MQDEAEALLPARAGMVPPATSPATSPAPAPRTRGDGPARDLTWPRPGRCSPHARGWSRREGRGHDVEHLLPARAGMVPATWARRSAAASGPRTRGDGPAGRAGSGPRPVCSPHARGWSPRQRAGPRDDRLLPARAGMVPRSTTSTGCLRPAPRTRGDGPGIKAMGGWLKSCSPHAGMAPRRSTGSTRPWSAPRTRGDGPCAGQGLRPRPVCYGRSSAEPEHRKEAPPIEGLPPTARA